MDLHGERALRDFLASPRLLRWLTLALCLILGLKAIIFFSRFLLVAAYPYEWSAMDGYFIYHGLRLISGEPLYHAYDSVRMPFNYVPLYAVVAGIMAKAFGPGAWYERAFSMTCAVFIAILIYRAVIEANGNRMAGLFASLLLFAPAALSVWFIVRGIDVLATLLMLAAALAVSSGERPSRGNVIVSILLLAAAFYTKEPTIFVTAGVITYLSTRDFKLGVAAGIAYCLIVLALLGIIQLLSDGWFLENTVIMHSTHPRHLKFFVDPLRTFLVSLFVVFPLAFVWACRGIGRKPDIWAIYFFSTLFSTFLAAKVGSALNYFIPLFTATCINVGLWLGDKHFFAKRPLRYGGVLALLLIQVLYFFTDQIRIPSEEDYDQAARLNTYIRMNPGPLFIERIDSFAVLNGRDVLIEDVALPYIIESGKLDRKLFEDAFRERRFSLVVLNEKWPIVEILFWKTLQENYVVVDKVDIGLFFDVHPYAVLEPRKNVQHRAQTYLEKSFPL